MNPNKTILHFGSARTLPPGDWAKVCRGAFVRTDTAPNSDNPWDVRCWATRVRALAIACTRQAEGATVFTSEAGLILQGYRTWRTAPDLIAWPQERSNNKQVLPLPSLQVGDVSVPEVRFRFINAERFGSVSGDVTLWDPLTQPDNSFGTSSSMVEVQANRRLVVARPGECAVDAAVREHPLIGIAAASSVLSACSNFANNRQTESRQQAQDLQDKMLAISQKAIRNKRKANAVLTVSDPGISSSGEAFAWWMVCCIVPFELLETQHPVTIEGRHYYLDIAIPQFMVCVETDGVTKFERGQQSHQAFLARQTKLRNAGWEVIRLTTEDTMKPEATLRKLAQMLDRFGVPVSSPNPGLWHPVPPEALAPDRRF